MKKTAFFILILLSVFLLVSCIFDFGADSVNVTFLVNDGAGTVKTQAIVRGGTVLEPAVTYNGHTLIGWYYKNSPYDFGEPVKADITLEAHWTGASKEQTVLTNEVLSFSNGTSKSIQYEIETTPDGSKENKTTVDIPEGAITTTSTENSMSSEITITTYSVAVATIEFTISGKNEIAVAGIDCKLEITENGEKREVSDFNGKSVKVTTYTLKGLENPSVVYNGEGDQPTGVSYDEDTGLLSFNTTHFSTFLITSDAVAYISETKYAYNTLSKAIDAVNGATTDSTLILLEDIYCSGTVTITSNWDTVIDFNGHTLAFNAEYISKNADKRGAIKLGNGHSLTLTDSSASKTGKFTNTATTTSGNVYIVGVYSESNSSVIIDGLNVEMTSTSSSSGQIYGVVYSATSGQASKDITIKNSQITLKANTGTSVGALVEATYVGTLVIDNIDVTSEGIGVLVRTNAKNGPLISIKDSKFDMECPSSGKCLNIYNSSEGSIIDNVEINIDSKGSTDGAIINENVIVKNSEINISSTGASRGINISAVSAENGTTIENNEITVTSSSSSYTAAGIYFSNNNNIITDCIVVATNTSIEAKAYSIENSYFTAKNNLVQGGYYTGNLKGIGVKSGYYSVDPDEWVIEGYTSKQESEWYTVREATDEDVVCVLTYTEDSEPIVEKFNSLSNAFSRIEALQKKEDMLLTIKKDCSSSITGAKLYCNVIIEEGTNVSVNSLTPYLNNPSSIIITNNGNLTMSSFSANTNKPATVINKGTMNCTTFTVDNFWSFTNSGAATFKTLTVAAATADKNGAKNKDAGIVNNNGSVTILDSGTLTMKALTGYALNNTTDSVKATLHPLFTNNGSIVGTDDTSSMAVNFPITGTSSYDTGTYAWSTSDTAWVTGGRVLNVEKDLTYNLLSDAISDADKGQTLKILKSMSFGSGLEIAKNLTIDLNGNVLDFWNYTNVAGKAKAFTIKSATLTIDDSSTNHNGKITTTAGPAIWIQNNSSLILNNGIIENTGRGGSYSCVVFIAGYQNDEIGATNAHLVVNGGKIVASSEEWTDPSSGKYYPAGDGIYIFGHENTTDMPSITISGGEVTANGTVIVGQGSYNNTQITITGGKVESYENAAIYHPQYGQLSISGTAVVKGLSAICLKGGTLNISGGTLAATKTGTYAEPSAAIGSGTNITGDALYIEDNYNRGIVVNITGGTFSTVATGAQDWRVLFSGTTPAVVNDNRQQPN